MTTKGEHSDAQVQLVTNARRPHSEEISGRARRYLISMGIRTICLVLAIFVLDGWLRLVAIAAAIVLPWFAVVLANAGPVIDDESPEYVTITRPEIEERKPDDVSGGAAAPSKKQPDEPAHTASTAQHRSA